MKLLLDTHVAIWALTASCKLDDTERNLIADETNMIFVSAASIWEITIKHGLGHESAPPFSGRDALAFFFEAGFGLLDVTAHHAAAVDLLPSYHADPFDRLIIAQALTEPLRLLTHDRQVAAYSDSILVFP